MTLVEVSIVMALAMLVVLGMLTFYINSQATWTDGSTQALAQRDGTLLVEALADKVRGASSVEVQPVPDSLHVTLILRDPGGDEFWRFWWNVSDDSLVHQGSPGHPDRGPVVASQVTRFQLDTLRNAVDIRLIELRSTNGQLVRTTSAVAYRNRSVSP
jgi:hypothetical protein